MAHQDDDQSPKKLKTLCLAADAVDKLDEMLNAAEKKHRRTKLLDRIRKAVEPVIEEMYREHLREVEKQSLHLVRDPQALR